MGRKVIKYVFVVGSLLLSVAVIGLCVALHYLLRGDVRESSAEIADYGNWSLSEQYSRLLIFPEEIPPSAEGVEYQYQYENGWTRPMCQIYLSYTLSEEEYEKEEKRLASLSWENGDGEVTPVRRDETSFGWPAYVAIDGYDFCYEYALMYEEKRTIIYIYAMNTVEEDLKFNREFLPDDYMEDFDDLSVLGTDRFTMYGGYLPSTE